MSTGSTVSYIREITCHGAPRQMGQQYGEQAGEVIHQCIAGRYARKNVTPDSAHVAAAAALLQRELPAVYDEMLGVAEGAQVEIGWLLSMNQWPQDPPQAKPSPLANAAGGACTSMLMRTAALGIVLAKNDDGAAGEISPWVLRRTEPEQGVPMLQLTYAGWLCGLDAMNAAGLVNSHNSVGSRQPRPELLLDIRLWTYHLMRTCRTVAEFWRGLTSRPLTGKGYNLAVADAQGEGFIIEAAVPRLERRGADAQFVAASNHFITPPLENSDQRQPDAKVISCNRLAHLCDPQTTPTPQNVDQLKRVLRDNRTWGACRHGGETKSVTLWSMIGIPQRGELLVCDGAPDQAEYVTHRIGPA